MFLRGFMYYTFDEVEEKTKELDDTFGKNEDFPYEIKQMCGFNFYDSFIELEKGWVQAPERDACFYCIKTMVELYGNKSEKIRFNEFNNFTNLSANYIPVSKKEIALKRKKNKKASKSIFGLTKKYRKNSNFTNRKSYEKYLKELSSQGISIIRRGKDNLFKDIFLAYGSFDKEENTSIENNKIYVDDKGIKRRTLRKTRNNKNFYYYIKGLNPKNNTFFLSFDSKDDLIESINQEIIKVNKCYGKNINTILDL